MVSQAAKDVKQNLFIPRRQAHLNQDFPTLRIGGCKSIFSKDVPHTFFYEERSFGSVAFITEKYSDFLDDGSEHTFPSWAIPLCGNVMLFECITSNDRNLL
jgi:hypothetical protein